MITMEKKHELDLRNTARSCRAEGEQRCARLVVELLDASRIDDISRMTEDSAYRERLYEEFGLMDADNAQR